MIAEDFFGDTLDLASRGMSHEVSALTEPAEGRTRSGMPEVEAVDAMRSADDRVVRHFLTFISAMDRARDATQLWRAGDGSL